MRFLILYLIIINVFALIQMYVDKQRAIKGKWRVKESRLMLTALLGGSAFSLLSVILFNHKKNSVDIVSAFIGSFMIHIFIAIYLFLMR